MKNIDIKDLWSINTMFTTYILTWIYRIAIIVIPIVGFYQFCNIVRYCSGNDVPLCFLAFLFIVFLSIVGVRLITEFLLVVFGIFNKLSSIEAIIKNKNS